MPSRDKSKKDPRTSPSQKHDLGTGTAGFFSDVVEGKSGVPANRKFEPLFWTVEIAEASEWFESASPGYFDDHINSSIPTFFEMTRGVVFALAKMTFPAKHPTLLDLGASEGTFCRAVSIGSGGRVSVHALEPNVKMKNKIKSSYPSVDWIEGALNPSGEPVAIEPGQDEIKCYDFDEKFDVITEIMTFQFITSERLFFIEQIARALSTNGLFVTCEKFSANDQKEFVDNEIIKDIYKSKYFLKSDIIKKNNSVIKGKMAHMMVDYQDYELVLISQFSVVAKFWDSGNFKGYVASESLSTIQNFLEYIPDLNSEYSCEKTPILIT